MFSRASTFTYTRAPTWLCCCMSFRSSSLNDYLLSVSRCLLLRLLFTCQMGAALSSLRRKYSTTSLQCRPKFSVFGDVHQITSVTQYLFCSCCSTKSKGPPWAGCQLCPHVSRRGACGKGHARPVTDPKQTDTLLMTPRSEAFLFPLRFISFI